MEIKSENIPTEIKQKPRWICWKWETRQGKPTKPPYDPRTGKYSKSNDSSTWVDFELAYKAYSEKRFDGIGFILNKEYTGIDFDDCLDPKTNQISEPSLSEVYILNSYTEISPSGKGLKTLVKANVPTGHHDEKIGIFDNGRYFCITGHVLQEISQNIESRQEEINALLLRRWPEDVKTLATEDDEEIIKRISNAKNGEKFQRLWSGDWSDYPSQSEADLALCCILAFWTQKDEQRIFDLFRNSGLYRDKWDKHDYGHRTIRKSLSVTREVFNTYLCTSTIEENQKKSPVDYIWLQNEVKQALLKGGMDTQNIVEVVGIIEDFSKQISKDRNIAGEIRQWVLATSGYFLATSGYIELHLATKQEKKAATIALLRMKSEGIIETYGEKKGCYRLVDDSSNEIDFIGVEDKIVDIKWPFEIENWVKILPKNIIVIAGEVNAGKTAFLLSTCYLNMGNHKINYFSSEMGPMELRDRLKKFEGKLEHWKEHINFRERASNFADVIKPNEVNMIDFLEITDEFYKVGGMIKEIFDKLKKGIAIIALQKNPKTDWGLGGLRSVEKARLYLAIEHGKMKIVKGKNWATEVNPNGLTRGFKLYQGAKFTPTTDWKRGD